MARQNLGALLGGVQKQVEEGANQSPVVEAVEPAPAPSPSPAPAARPKAVTAPKKSAQASVGFLDLQRKEARLTDDQANQLSIETRRLNKIRAGAGERITDNTLIRVAVDLLLSRSAELRGITENELRKSVGL